MPTPIIANPIQELFIDTDITSDVGSTELPRDYYTDKFPVLVAAIRLAFPGLLPKDYTLEGFENAGFEYHKYDPFNSSHKHYRILAYANYFVIRVSDYELNDRIDFKPVLPIFGNPPGEL